MKIAFYTANIGNFDRSNNKAECYYDAPVEGTPRFKSRYIKLNPQVFYPDADYWVYIDANMQLQISVEELVEKYKSDFISARRHPLRGCVYEEIEAVAKFNYDTKENLMKVASTLLDADFPKNFGLWEHGLLIMKNTPETISFLEAWWEFVKENSRRDQLSGAYLLWKNKLEFTDIPRSVVKYGGHIKANKEGGY